MEVIPGVGTDLVRFGITESEVTELLGNADKKYFTDSNCMRLQFNNLRMELSFEPENDNRLGWIEIHNPEATLNGRSLIGTPKNDVTKFVTDLLNEQPAIEDYGSFQSVSYDRHWVELQFQFDRLDNINVGVLYDEKESPVWPSS